MYSEAEPVKIAVSDQNSVSKVSTQLYFCEHYLLAMKISDNNLFLDPLNLISIPKRSSEDNLGASHTF